MHIVILVVLLLGAVVGPGLWVKTVLARYSRPNDRYPETGGELARRLLDALGLERVGAESTEKGDHYDPLTRTVRLSPENYSGRSLTAITVAAHEVGHAVQDARGFRPLKWRTRLVAWVAPIEKTGAAMLMLAPFVAAIGRLPLVGLATFVGGLITLGSGVVIHALTLPTELDASFARALPLLRERNVLRPGDEVHARRILTAAALTYVSAALMSLLNIARWWAIIRR
jgi:Zn-dependent membrane protease YugP